MKEKLVLRYPIKTMIVGAILLLFVLAACSSEPADETTADENPSESSDTVDEPTEIPAEATEVIDAPDEQEETGEPDETQTGDSGSTFDIYEGGSEDDVITTESGLQYLLFETGNGPSPESGQIVSVHYTGFLDDGTIFDSSVERGTPFQFPLGQGAVIRGWDEGIALLNEGSKARLIIPSDLGYGAGGSGGVIPPNATLVFDVELVEILPGSPELPTEVSESDYTVTESGLMYYDIESGNSPTPNEGQAVILHFTAWLDDNTKLGSTIDTGQPIPYLMGSGELFPGFEEGIASMQIGGIRQMVFPPELAYGETGTPDGQIPPDSTLIFQVEVLGIQ
jgi:peptidylprolyl isomerase